MITQQSTPQTTLDPARLQAIRGAMDPLAIVGVFLYYVAKDLTGREFSQDTLLWFVAAASAVRTMMMGSIDRILAARDKALEHERTMQLHRLNATSVAATIAATEATRQATEILATTISTRDSEISGVGDIKINTNDR